MTFRLTTDTTDCPESLGEYYGREFLSLADAREAADALREDLRDAGNGWEDVLIEVIIAS